MSDFAIRVGPVSSAAIFFYSAQLARELRRFIVPLPSRNHGCSSDKYQVSVLGHRPGVPRRADEIEAIGEGFCLRFSRRAREGNAYFWGDLPAWQVATPLRQLFAWIMDAEKTVLVHASCVNLYGKSIMFAGPSGSGKSTIAAACVADSRNHLTSSNDLLVDGKVAASDARFEFRGDDWLPVTFDEDSRKWLSWQLYSSLKLSEKMVARLACRAPVTELVHKTKKVLCEEPAESDMHTLRLIVVPSIVKTGLSIDRIEPHEALRSIAPSTLLQSSGVTSGALDRLGALVRDVPCYKLAVSSDTLPLVPVLVREMARGPF